MLKIILLIILVVVVLSLSAIMFVDFIINRLYFRKFYRDKMDQLSQLLEVTCGEIKENKILFSLTDRYTDLKNMLDNVKTLDDMSKCLDEMNLLSNDSTNMYYEKIKNLNDDEKEECTSCHKKYLKMLDDFKRK
jgi:hypothetical protein